MVSLLYLYTAFLPLALIRRSFDLLSRVSLKSLKSPKKWLKLDLAIFSLFLVICLIY
jgi:hypothetical protein